MVINEILEVASYAGKIMLESGAEAYRVEETMNRICTSLCYSNCNNCFCFS